MRLLLVLAAVNGFLAVALGAFGAHGLHIRLSNLPDATKRMEWWHLASSYQLLHALAIGLVALVAARSTNGSAALAGYAFFTGILLFSGSLYAMTLTGFRALGMLTPLGGLSLLFGWGCLAWSAWRG